MSTSEISIISIVIAFLGTILIPTFRNRYEMIKDLQNKINLLNSIEADIIALKKAHSELTRLTPVPQTLDNIAKLLEYPAKSIDPSIGNIFSIFLNFVSSLKENKHLLVNMHSNFFANFDNYISKEIGSLSYEIAEKVITFYNYAKTFCDTSKNYIESLKNFNYIEEKIKKINIELLKSYYEDSKNELQLLKNL